MKTMTDTNGQQWNVGDLVLRGSKEQGIVKTIVSQRIVTVQFPAKHVCCFVNDLVNLSKPRDPDQQPETQQPHVVRVGPMSIRLPRG